MSVRINNKIVKDKICWSNLDQSLIYVRCYAWGIEKNAGVMRYYDRSSEIDRVRLSDILRDTTPENLLHIGYFELSISCWLK